MEIRGFKFLVELGLWKLGVSSVELLYMLVMLIRGFLKFDGLAVGCSTFDFRGLFIN